jgi:hypothetical protein
MYFMEGLSRVNGKSVIFTVVDRFSKYAHFITLVHPYTTTIVARVFFDGIVRLHGIPSSILSDQDPIFTNSFWRELFRLADVQLNLSSAFHLQSGRQAEATNKIIAMYLHCLTGDHPRQWLQWLPWVDSATTRRIRLQSRQRRSAWSTAGACRLCAHTPPARHVFRLCISNCSRAMSS